jgi:hypothetical protein
MVVNCPQMSSVDFHSRCLLRDLRTLTPALIYASTCARIAAGCMAWHWSLGSLIFVAVPRDTIATGTEEPNLHVLTAAELNNWFAKLTNHDTQTIQYDADGPFFTHTEANCLHVENPQKLERLPFLARTLATITYESKDFAGALLWFTGWGVWNYSEEGIGYRIVEAIHRAAGQQKSFEDAPGHHFRGDELNEATGLLLQPMVFGWDANYVPQWSYGPEQFFLHVSHDSFVTVVTRTKEYYDKVFEILTRLDFSPTEARKTHSQRFCHQR